MNRVIFKDGGIWNYNTYEPPKWYSDHFYSEGKIQIPVVKNIPSVYEKFLKFLHIVHCFCVLVTIGRSCCFLIPLL